MRQFLILPSTNCRAKRQRAARVGGRGELGDPQLDVLVDHADGHGVEPAAVGEVAERECRPTANSRRAWAVTCTLPNRETCEVSISLTFCKVVLAAT